MNKKETFAIVKGIDPAKRIVSAFGNTANPDRDGDIIPPTAFAEHLALYRQNPVIIASHTYRTSDGSPTVIGKAIEVKISETGLLFTMQFADTPLANLYWSLYRDGFMRAFSVGFIVTRPPRFRNGDNDPDFPAGVDRIFEEVELLEISCVAIPSNRESLVLSATKSAFKDDQDWKQQESLKSAVKQGYEIPDQVWEQLDTKFDDIYADVFGKRTIPFSVHGTVPTNGDTWNGARARSQITRWAGGPDPEDINFRRFRQGFAWFDEEAAESLASYKLPHHLVVDGELVSNQRGTVAAMAVLLGARGGIDIPDRERRGVYNHLAREYALHEIEPPEFKAYAEAELKELFADSWDEDIPAVLADFAAKSEGKEPNDPDHTKTPERGTDKPKSGAEDDDLSLLQQGGVVLVGYEGGFTIQEGDGQLVKDWQKLPVCAIPTRAMDNLCLIVLRSNGAIRGIDIGAVPHSEATARARKLAERADDPSVTVVVGKLANEYEGKFIYVATCGFKRLPEDSPEIQGLRSELTKLRDTLEKRVHALAVRVDELEKDVTDDPDEPATGDGYMSDLLEGLSKRIDETSRSIVPTE